MNSLVGYGVSSDSDSDGDVHTGGDGGAGDEAPAGKKTRNFLLESGSASSDLDSESEPEEEEPDAASSSPQPQQQPPPHLTPASSARQPALPSHKLPPPPLGASSDGGVFANPFKAQADRKLSALQKHVPLTMQAKPSQIGGKRMCVSYRKDGRCRFGIKCKFAHDSDLQVPATTAAAAAAADCHPPASGEAPASQHGEARAGGSCGGLAEEVESGGGQHAKKRRVGLTDTLIPPKRAMKQYAVHRDRERINMS